MRAFVLGLLLPAAALAAPTSLPYQGRLFDADGAALSGTHTLALTLHDTETGPAAFTQTFSGLPVQDGYFSLVLDVADGGAALDSDLLADGATWLGVSVDGAALGPLTPLGAVPYAAATLGTYLPTATGTACAVAGALSWDAAAKAVRACDGAVWTPLGGRVESVQIGRWVNGDPLMVDVVRDGRQLRPANGAGFRFMLHHPGVVAGRNSVTVWVRIYTNVLVHSTTTTGGNDPAGSGLYLVQTRSTGNSIETVNGDSYLSISGPGGYAPHYGDRLTFTSTTNNTTQVSIVPIDGGFGLENGQAVYEPF